MVSVMLLGVSTNVGANSGYDAINAALRAIDTVPSAEALLKATEDAPQLLAATAQNQEADEYTRTRAVSLLSMFPTASTRSLLLSISRVDPAPAIRDMAIYTVARTFGAPGDEELVALLADAVFENNSANSRDNAVRGLRWIDHPNAEELLAKLKESNEEDLRQLAAYVDLKRERRMKDKQK